MDSSIISLQIFNALKLRNYKAVFGPYTEPAESSPNRHLSRDHLPKQSIPMWISTKIFKRFALNSSWYSSLEVCEGCRKMLKNYVHGDHGKGPTGSKKREEFLYSLS
jgi:hypothetical protein